MSKKKITDPKGSMEELIARAVEAAKAPFTPDRKTDIADLDLLTIGSVNDMFNEKSRDSIEWREEASQGDMDKF